LSNASSHTFDKDGCGSLLLEVSDTRRDFFELPNLNSIPFSVKGVLEATNPTPFYFFEWQKIQYSYIVETTQNFAAPFELRINNRKIKSSVERGSSHLLTGQFSFDDQVGETSIELRDYSNRLIFQLNTEVFPQKMDYKSDYQAMMADISEIIQNLAYDMLKDTFRRSKAKLRGVATEPEWWSILDALFEQLIINLQVIKRQPKHTIIRTEKVLPIEKIRSVSKNSNSWFAKNNRHSNNSKKGIIVATNVYFTHALSSKKHITYDIYENRFIAWAIKNIIQQLKCYQNYLEKNLSTKDYSPLLKRMKKQQSRLQGILRESPFNEVSKFEKRSHFSTSLTRGAGYRDFMHIYLLLTRGLELADNDIFKIEQKNISTLYEYWCFLKLVQVLKEQNSSNIQYQDLIHISTGKYKVQLEKGKQSKVSFKKEGTDETTTIYFNRTFTLDNKKVYTFNQIPDYSIEFNKKGFEKPFWYLFDAKYRFEESKNKIINSYNVPQDAIGQLHRYRDSILHTEPVNSTYRAAIKNLGGIILYPYPLSETEFKNNVFFKSIDQVNIGALPFLPSKSGLVSELLNNLINKLSAEDHFEQFIEMDNSEYISKRDSWKEWITIGVVPKLDQQERIRFINETLLFHIPYVKNTNSKIYLTNQLLICKSGTKEATLYDVKNWEIMTRKELVQIGTNWEHRQEKYIAFHLDNPKLLFTPSKLSPGNFRYATKEGLNRYLANPKQDKDCFYLTNPDAARLFDKLKKANINFKISWSTQGSDPSKVEFEIGHQRVLSSDKYLDLHFLINTEFVHLKNIFEYLEEPLRSASEGFTTFT